MFPGDLCSGELNPSTAPVGVKGGCGEAAASNSINDEKHVKDCVWLNHLCLEKKKQGVETSHVLHQTDAIKSERGLTKQTLHYRDHTAGHQRGGGWGTQKREGEEGRHLS